MLIKIARTVAIYFVKPQSAILNSVVSQTFCVCVSNTNSHSGAGSYDFISNVGIAPNAVSNHGHSPNYFEIFRFQNGNDSQKSCHIGCSTLVPGHALKVQKLVKLQDLLKPKYFKKQCFFVIIFLPNVVIEVQNSNEAMKYSTG